MAGRVLGGRYSTQDKIGTGGMAAVYRGIDAVLGRTVAIKTMLPQYAADPSFAARFKQEAQAAAALQSPYIVSIYDWGKDGDIYYIVMEYLRGTDLKSGIRKHGALSCKKVAQIGSQISQALSVAHRHDIIHRDIKPQNIMVQPDGNVKVMDFGIARAKNSHLTADNSVLGTAHYVSPEQTQGKELGPTSDIYSLGVVMYEAACGRVPFEGDDAIAVALKQVKEKPQPPTELNPEIDPQLEAIILKCMQKNPKDRFQTAEELSRVLRDYLAGRTSAVNEATTLLSGEALGAANGAETTAPNKRIPAGAADGTKAMPMVGYYSSAAARTKAREPYLQPTNSNASAAYDDSEKKPSGKLKWIIAALVVIVLIAAGVFAYALLSHNSPELKPVPNLVGMTQDTATKTINDSKFFTLGAVTKQSSDSIESGKVISQTPNSGETQVKGTRINLVISSGKPEIPTVTVPDLNNMSPAQANAALDAVGLQGRAGDLEYSDSVDKGRVADQNPKAGSTLKKGESVTYRLSQGKETAQVPDVTGMSRAKATRALQEAGFTPVEDTPAYSNDVAADEVVSQSLSGTQPKGSKVSIVISKGKRPEPQAPARPSTTTPAPAPAPGSTNTPANKPASPNDKGDGNKQADKDKGSSNPAPAPDASKPKQH